MHLLRNSNEPQNSLKNKLKITINLALIYVHKFFNEISNRYISDSVNRTKFTRCSHKMSLKKLKIDFIIQ